MPGIPRQLVAITVLLTAATACGADTARNPNGDTVVRSSTGDLATKGGARRLPGEQSQAVDDDVNPAAARNVILLIGDGMGDSEITAARNYTKGAGGSFAGLDALPLTGQATTYALDQDGKPDYVTDSAAGATAWSTGTKTYNGALGVDIRNVPLPTVLELAKAGGLATGDVTTAAIQDATPAALYSHITNRGCQGPVETAIACPAGALEHGGPGSITEQLLTTRPDVALGGGAQTFEQVAVAGDYRGKTLAVQAKERGYQIVRTATELANVGKADQDAPVLGLFADDNLPERWTGPAAAHQGYLQPPARCTQAERAAGMPSLAQMTQKAIDLLKERKRGFFLQVEGAAIDKMAHAANPCGQIGETVDFDEAVHTALEFARTDGHTLIAVAADHGHSGQIVESLTEEDLRGIAQDSKVPVEQVRDSVYPGLTRTLITADDARMTISYGTSANVQVKTQGHTGTQVRIAAYGPRAADVVGLTDQTDLFFTVTGALGLDRDLRRK